MYSDTARVIPCDGCLKGRMTKPKVFKQSRSGSDKPTRPFQHVQADIMVNRSTTSREGFKYVLVLVCVYTRIVYGYGMERKSEALSRFKRFRDDICAFHGQCSLLTCWTWFWQRHRDRANGCRRCLYGHSFYRLRPHKWRSLGHDIAQSVFSVHRGSRD